MSNVLVENKTTHCILSGCFHGVLILSPWLDFSSILTVKDGNCK
jgi:hypothetical protein